MSSSQAAAVDDVGSGSATRPRRAVAVGGGVVFLDLLGFGIIIPILPFYVRSFGLSDLFIGLLAASYSLAQFVAAPTLGRISDERGRRPVLMLSVGVSGVAWTVFGLAAEIDSVAGTTAGVLTLFVALLLLALSPALGRQIAAPGGPPRLTGELLVLLAFGALASFGNGALTVGLSTLVSQGASAGPPGVCVRRDAGRRESGPNGRTATYVIVYWSPSVAGALLLVPVALALLTTR